MRRREVDATFRRLTSVDHAVFWQTRVSSFTIRTTGAAAPLLGQLAAKHAADGPAAARAPVRVSLGLRRLGRARHAAVAVQQVAAGHHERVPPLDVANLARDRVPRVLRRRVRVCHRASRRGERFRELRRAHHGSAVHDDRFVPSRVDALSGRTLWTGGHRRRRPSRRSEGRRRRRRRVGESSSGSEETSPSSDGGISRVASATRDARARRERSPLAPLVPGTRRCPAAPGGRVAKKCSASSSVRSTRAARGGSPPAVNASSDSGSVSSSEDRVASNCASSFASSFSGARGKRERGDPSGVSNRASSRERKEGDPSDSLSRSARVSGPGCGESVTRRERLRVAARHDLPAAHHVVYGGGDKRVPLGVFARLLEAPRRVAPGPGIDAPRHLPGPHAVAVQGDQRLVVLVLAKRGEALRGGGRVVRTARQAAGAERLRDFTPDVLRATTRLRPFAAEPGGAAAAPLARSPRRAHPKHRERRAARDDARSRGASAASERIRDTLPASEARKGRVKPEPSVSSPARIRRASRASSARPSWSPMSTSFSQMRLTRIRRSRHSSNPRAVQPPSRACFIASGSADATSRSRSARRGRVACAGVRERARAPRSRTSSVQLWRWVSIHVGFCASIFSDASKSATTTTTARGETA